MRAGRPRLRAGALAARRCPGQPGGGAHDDGAPQRHRPAAAREAVPGEARGAGGAIDEYAERGPARRAPRAHLHVLPSRARARGTGRADTALGGRPHDSGNRASFSRARGHDRATPRPGEAEDRRRIHETFRAAGRFVTRQRPGPYQVQALIAGAHADAKSWEATRWPDILRSYDALLAINDSPVVRLNRAIAVWHVHGAEQAYVELFPLAEDLDRYHLYHATRGELLRALGRTEDARAADERALELTENPAERALLEGRLG